MLLQKDEGRGACGRDMKKLGDGGYTRGFSGSSWGEPMTGEGKPRHLRALTPMESNGG